MDFLQNPFLWNALIASLLASFASGVVGSYAVINRMVFIAGSIAHSILGFMGLFLFLERTQGIFFATPLLGALLGAIFSSILIGWISLRFEERKDAVIASVWSTGMAFGVIFISMTPGYNTEILDFLFGNLLWTSREDLYILAILDALLFLSVAAFYQQFLLICFDENQAKLKGMNVEAWYIFLLILIGLSIVVLVQVMGIILLITLLSLPAMSASLYTKKLFPMMFLGFLIASFLSVAGIFTSYALNFPTGSTISLIAALFYLCSLLGKKRKLYTKNL